MIYRGMIEDFRPSFPMRSFVKIDAVRLIENMHFQQVSWTSKRTSLRIAWKQFQSSLKWMRYFSAGHVEEMNTALKRCCAIF